MHHAHHWAALLSVGIGVFTAIAISMWVAVRAGKDTDG